MRKRRKKLIGNLFLQLLVTGVLLISFALPHHVLPRYRANRGKGEVPAAIVTPIPTTLPTEKSVETAAPTEAPDTRTEWQKKFADKFTDTVVVTENAYSSPRVSLSIETKEFVNSHGQTTVYYVADIYVGSLDCFRSCVCGDELEYYRVQPMAQIAAEHNALCAISGDFVSYQAFEGYSIAFRDGQLLKRGDYSTYQICALFADGTMETYFPSTYKLDELMERGLWQLWHFGPLLINADGSANTNYDWQNNIAYANPRSAIGYFEPGHYCYLVADGRQDFSVGLRLEELAQIMIELGCKTAYNLDGGGTAQMYFNGGFVSSPSNGEPRELGDILYVVDREVGE